MVWLDLIGQNSDEQLSTTATHQASSEMCAPIAPCELSQNLENLSPDLYGVFCEFQMLFV